MLSNEDKTEVLNNYLNTLNVTNKICRNDVISLEDTLGENIITKFKETIYFSTNPTDMYVQEVKHKIQNRIKDLQMSMKVSKEEFIRTYNYAMATIYVQIGKISREIKPYINMEILQKLKDPSLLIREEDDVFINVENHSIIDVLSYYPLQAKLASYYTKDRKSVV